MIAVAEAGDQALGRLFLSMVPNLPGKIVPLCRSQFADPHRARGVDVGFAHGLHQPACSCRHPVTLGARVFFRFFRHVVSPQLRRIPLGPRDASGDGVLG